MLLCHSLCHCCLLFLNRVPHSFTDLKLFSEQGQFLCHFSPAWLLNPNSKLCPSLCLNNSPQPRLLKKKSHLFLNGLIHTSLFVPCLFINANSKSTHCTQLSHLNSPFSEKRASGQSLVGVTVTSVPHSFQRRTWSRQSVAGAHYSDV